MGIWISCGRHGNRRSMKRSDVLPPRSRRLLRTRRPHNAAGSGRPRSRPGRHQGPAKSIVDAALLPTRQRHAAGLRSAPCPRSPKASLDLSRFQKFFPAFSPRGIEIQRVLVVTSGQQDFAPDLGNRGFTLVTVWVEFAATSAWQSRGSWVQVPSPPPNFLVRVVVSGHDLQPSNLPRVFLA